MPSRGRIYRPAAAREMARDRGQLCSWRLYAFAQLCGMATISAIEKIMPGGRLISRIAGAGFVASWDLACGWVVMNRTATLLLGATSGRPGKKLSATILLAFKAYLK